MNLLRKVLFDTLAFYDLFYSIFISLDVFHFIFSLIFNEVRPSSAHIGRGLPNQKQSFQLLTFMNFLAIFETSAVNMNMRLLYISWRFFLLSYLKNGLTGFQIQLSYRCYFIHGYELSKGKNV